MREIVETDLRIDVLDKGFVRLIDTMGTDSSIVQAARISYGRGTKTPEEDRKLIHYLMRNRHTSPFEMCEIKLHCKMPIFVARQWIRHRTASVNEYSARYSKLSDEFYIPEHLYSQDTVNKQGSGKVIIANEDQLLEKITQHCKEAYNIYEELLENGVSRELARMVLPVNYYTEWYWKIDLHNLLNFLRLRTDSHAQGEIQDYANAIAQIVQSWVPVVYEAYLEYK